MNSAVTIEPPRIEGEGPYRISARLRFPGGEETLWFETPLRPVDAADSFLLVLLPRAMREGLDIVVEGELSSQLYYNVTQYYLAFLRTLEAARKPISIVARRLTTRRHGGAGVFTGFSAGVDSFATILSHMKDVPPEFRVTHLLFNNVGSHGQTRNDQQIFEERYRRLESRAMGLPFLPVTSNLDEVMRSKFEKTTPSATARPRSCSRTPAPNSSIRRRCITAMPLSTRPSTWAFPTRSAWRCCRPRPPSASRRAASSPASKRPS